MGVFGVDFFGELVGEDGFLPEWFSGVEVEGEDGLGFLFFVCGGEEEFVAHDDG